MGCSRAVTLIGTPSSVRTLVRALQAQLADLVEMMAERSLSQAQTTIVRWVQRYAPIHQALEPFWHTHRTIVACR